MLPTTSTSRNAAINRARSPFDSDFGILLEDFLFRPTNGWEAWRPVADLYELDDVFMLEMELAGFQRDDVDITVDKGVLTVTGQRTTQETESEPTFYLRERSVERFSRSFSLPSSVDQDSVKAELENGLLRVSLPKTAEAKPRRIEVHSAS